MPTISFKTRIRAIEESVSLNLNVYHELILGQPSEQVYNIKPSLLAGLHVLLPSNLQISISGRLNRSCIPPAVLEKSRIALHLVQYFKTNAENLCINAVSGPCILDRTGLTTITVSSSRPLSEPSLPFSITLDGIQLLYDWQTNSASTIDDSLNPFSSTLPLPYLTLVEDVAQRFTASQLVRRYPIIFGNWSKQLHLEKKIALSLWDSIQNIIEKSPNESFRNTTSRTLARIRSRMLATLIRSTSSLSEHLENAGENNTWSVISSLGDDRDAFSYCMHHLYCRNMRRPAYKSHSSAGIRITSEQNDLDLFELDPSSPSIAAQNLSITCDVTDLFDDEHRLHNSDAYLLLEDSGSLEDAFNESSSTTFYPEEMRYEGFSTALHTNLSPDAWTSPKHSTGSVMGMDLCGAFIPNPTFSSFSVTTSAMQDVRGHVQAKFSEGQAPTVTHDAGNLDLFDLIPQHEYEIGIIPFDRVGHETNFMAGRPSDEDSTLSYFEGPQNHSHASQSHQDIDSAAFGQEISQTDACLSQDLGCRDIYFSVIEF